MPSNKLTPEQVDKIAQILRSQMPVDGCHSGRGVPHSQACFHTCYDSWRKLRNQLGLFCDANTANFDMVAWFKRIEDGE